LSLAWQQARRNATAFSAFIWRCGAVGRRRNLGCSTVLQTYQTHRNANIYSPTPAQRRRTRRNRAAAAVVTLAIAVSGGILQQYYQQASLDARMGLVESPITTGPFAYFPR
jgi:hypothetical protein